MGHCDRSHAQGWTWQEHRGCRQKSWDDEPHEGHISGAVNCRGERIYNICGAEDLLPAGVYDYIKCDVPPTRSHVVWNDRKYLPTCARNDYVPRPNDYNNSKTMWGVLRDPATARESRESHCFEDSVRPQSARPALQTPGPGAPQIKYTEGGMANTRRTANTRPHARQRPSSAGSTGITKESRAQKVRSASEGSLLDSPSALSSDPRQQRPSSASSKSATQSRVSYTSGRTGSQCDVATRASNTLHRKRSSLIDGHKRRSGSSVVGALRRSSSDPSLLSSATSQVLSTSCSESSVCRPHDDHRRGRAEGGVRLRRSHGGLRKS